MALKFSKFIFYHIGRTAGYWVRDNVSRLYRETTEVGAFHCTPGDIEESEKDGLTSFTLVRHPLEWLRSYWLHDIVNGTPAGHVEAMLSKNFEEFLIEVLKYSRGNGGFVSEIFAPYVNKVDLVYRSEDLPVPIVELLGQHDPSISLENFTFTRKANEGAVFDLADYAKADEKILSDILSAEIDFFSKFGYVNVPEKMVGTVDGQSKIFLPVTSTSKIFKESGVESVYPRYFSDSSRPMAGQLAIKDFHHISYALQDLDLGGKDVVDMGAADCGLSELMISAGAKCVHALDVSFAHKLKNYIAQSYSGRIQLHEASFYDVPSELSRQADIVLSVNLLHNLSHVEKFLLEIHGLLKNAGLFFVHVLLWEDVIADSTAPLWMGFGKLGQILQYPCIGLYNETGLVELFSNYGFEFVKKGYDFNFGPCAGFSSAEIDGTRFGPVKVCGLLFQKSEIKRMMESWDVSRINLSVPLSASDDSELSRMARELVERNKRLSADAKNLMLDIGAREGVINSLRGQIFELNQVVDELRTELVVARSAGG
ncbi:class I SAM-dependent methyltransferase [Burkholderia cenocepacia]|uniref:class I SAM-dependent methyltransferase n=1 Tax=Burkholderia cenocepacia TaxID=95486 RepID=UPI002ABDF60B|nr:class I SAM-dependent methyltransferase [Burkholderia cenocepacia]